jgi:hypothetical protein
MDIQPDLSVCIVAPLEQEALFPLLHSLYATADFLAVEAVVVTSRETAAALQECFPQALLYETDRPEPPAVAGNRALRLARGRYLALLTGAAVFPAGALLRLVTFLDDHPEVGLAGPYLQAMDGGTRVAAGIFPSFFRLAAASIWGPIAGRFWPRFLYNPAFSREVDWLRGACLLIRREVLLDIGLLAEGFSLLWDLEYGWRAARAGWRAFFLREAQVLCGPQPHLQTGTLLAEGSRYFYRKVLGCRSWRGFLSL